MLPNTHIIYVGSIVVTYVSLIEDLSNLKACRTLSRTLAVVIC